MSKPKIINLYCHYQIFIKIEYDNIETTILVKLSDLIYEDSKFYYVYTHLGIKHKLLISDDLIYTDGDMIFMGDGSDSGKLYPVIIIMPITLSDLNK
jgi:hypothetical protein